VRAQQVAVDGARGDVVIDPDQAAIADLDRRQRLLAQDDAQARSEASLDAVTLDGVRVDLLANIGTPDESPRAREMGARGVGLFRTEFLFLERSTAPTEDEQTSAYREVRRRVRSASRHDPPARRRGRQANPVSAHGAGGEPVPWRSSTAARRQAARRVSDAAPGGDAGGVAGPVKVMAPMVADATDAATLLGLAEEARVQLETRGEAFAAVDLGVMLEIPSAILVGETYFGRLAFASLGTNDLLQYTLAVDRGNPALARYQDSLHPALLRLVREAIEASPRLRDRTIGLW